MNSSLSTFLALVGAKQLGLGHAIQPPTSFHITRGLNSTAQRTKDTNGGSGAGDRPMLGANTSMYAGVPTPYLLAHATNVLNHPPTLPQVFRTNTPTTWPEHVNDTPDTSDTTTPLLLQHITPFNVLQDAKVAKFPHVLNTAASKNKHPTQRCRECFKMFYIKCFKMF